MESLREKRYKQRESQIQRYKDTKILVKEQSLRKYTNKERASVFELGKMEKEIKETKRKTNGKGITEKKDTNKERASLQVGEDGKGRVGERERRGRVEKVKYITYQSWQW